MSAFRTIHYNEIVSTSTDTDSVIIELSNNDILHLAKIATAPPAYIVDKPSHQESTRLTSVITENLTVNIKYDDDITQDSHLSALKLLFLEDLDFDKTGLATSANQVITHGKLDVIELNQEDQESLLVQIEDNQVSGNQVTQIASRYLNMTQTNVTITTADTIILPAGPKDYIQILHTGGRPVFIQFDATPTTASTRIINRTAITYDGSTPTNAIHASTVTTGTATLTIFTA